MKIKNLLMSFLVIIGINSFANDISNKDKATLLLEKLFKKDQDRSVLKFINDKKYIQHNLQAADGKEGLIAYLDYLKGKDIETKVIRVFEDKNFVFVQNISRFEDTYSNIIDIFRFEDGLIVEHWDNIEETEKTDLISNLPIKVKESSNTEKNKQLIKKLNDSNKIKNHLLLGEGEFVLSVNETDTNQALYELYYILNNEVKYKWSIKEEIPNKTQWQNTNGKF